MRVSIIVPVLNEEPGILATLQALESLEGEKEIFVVDGGSTDGTRQLVESRGAEVVHAPRGRGHQQRAGAERASGQVLWFVHADTLPPADAIQHIARAVAEGAAGGNFRLRFDGQSRAARQLTFVYPLLRFLGLCYGDSGMFVLREVYERVGGFREIALFEDLDLFRRLRREGRFVNLRCCLVTSSRRFEKRNLTVMWLHWIALQLLYWCGVSPNRLARWYGR